jgi:hypothetical protein
MRRNILFAIFIIFSITLQAQKDSAAFALSPHHKVIPRESGNINIRIYPVPVREDYFTIRSEKEISFIKVTNIIGQDIYKAQYNNPLTITKIYLDNPKRGMYLVTVIFSDGVRVVKKILIEHSE